MSVDPKALSLERPMFESGLLGHTARWLVCGSGRRWIDAVRRFAPDLMPGRAPVAVAECEASQIPIEISGGDPVVILWQIERPRLAEACGQISEISLASPKTLQIAAALGLADWHQAALSELGCRAIVQHPEELMGLTTLIGGYFASLPKNLD